MKLGAPFFTRRFFLDNVRNRAQNRGGEFYVGPFKSFWVSATNNSSFVAEIVINTTVNKDRGLPLRLNQCQAFGEKTDDACIEVPVAQPGVWVDITFSQDEDLSVGSVVVALSGEVSIKEGSSHLSAKVTATNAGAELIPASDLRSKVILQNKGAESVWVGNLTAGELLNAEWKIICTEIPPGGSLPWENPASLHGKTEFGNADLSRLTFLK